MILLTRPYLTELVLQFLSYIQVPQVIVYSLSVISKKGECVPQTIARLCL